MIPKKLRVLVVDDSAFNRRAIADALVEDDDVEIVGKAGDGEEALRLVAQEQPDLITLDLEMPRMDGFTFLRILMAKQPIPVIVVSSYAQQENVFKALELGALDFVTKPDRRVQPSATDIRAELREKVAIVRGLRSIDRLAARRHASSDPPVLETKPSLRLPSLLVGVAASTGGPTALLEVFSRIPASLPAAFLVAQHMPDKFTRTFAERLDKRSPLRVSEAQDGAVVTSGAGYVCPGKSCMEITFSTGQLRVRVGAPGSSDRYVPSADRLLRSMAAARVPAKLVALVLTGMGDDGTEGAKAVRDAGGVVVAESSETAIVSGMPGAVIRAGLADHVAPLGALPELLASL